MQVVGVKYHNIFNIDVSAKLWTAFNLKPVLLVVLLSCVSLQQAEEKENAGIHSELHWKAASIKS